MDQNATFRPVAKGDVRRIGTRAVMLTGFTMDEADAVRNLLTRIDASDVRVIQVQAAMLERHIGEVLDENGTGDPVPAGKLPRVLFMSGLTGSEFHDLLDRYVETDAPRPIFAAATERNLHFTVKQLLLELLAEHRAMAARRTAPSRPEEPRT